MSQFDEAYIEQSLSSILSIAVKCISSLLSGPFGLKQTFGFDRKHFVDYTDSVDDNFVCVKCTP